VESGAVVPQASTELDSIYREYGGEGVLPRAAVAGIVEEMGLGERGNDLYRAIEQTRTKLE
jgi:hypothetical protein